MGAEIDINANMINDDDVLIKISNFLKNTDPINYVLLAIIISFFILLYLSM